MENYLEKYSTLQKWLVKNESISINLEGSMPFNSFFLLSAKTLDNPSKYIGLWFKEVANLVRLCKKDEFAFDNLLDFSSSLNCSFYEILTDLAFISIDQNLLVEYNNCINELAILVDSDQIKFISAWSLFNLNQLEQCVKMCANIKLRTSQTLCLKGQAELELLEVHHAICSFEEAAKLDLDDVFIWFWLAKSHYANNQVVLAWENLIQCEKIDKGNLEVLAFMASIALDDDVYCELRTKTLFGLLNSYIELYLDNAHYCILLLRTALALQEKNKFLELLKIIDFKKQIQNKDFISSLTPLLHELARNNWMDVSANLLKIIT